MPVELWRVFVIAHQPVAGHARVALFEPAKGLMDLGGMLEPSGVDALFQPDQVGHQALLLLESDGLIFGFSAFAAAQHVEMLSGLGALDPDPGLLLPRIAR